MAWVRIHDAAMTHPKLVGLSDKAFRLWVWGLSYCQSHLTDGVIPAAAVPGAMTRAAAVLNEARLWHADERGWRVHDYLDWNDDRDTVRDRQQRAKDRLQRFRKRVTNGEETLSTQQRSNASITKPNQTKPVKEEQIHARETRYSAAFESFWSQFPKKVGKDAAWRAWDKRRPSADLVQTILEALRLQQSYLARDGGQFIPNPATWLNQGRWQDEPPTVANARRDGVQGGSRCPHAPRCATNAACVARVIADGRNAAPEANL